ncbi:YihY family inner membrane protein [Orrella sp. NBD-18]|uniref:UPF0761 membrane protein G3I67_01285 n=1 Tax=Sheuella amnicola TaxID=2707330 RepID=A0A6B2QX60_9BURK|nr:YihY family inner membrane protein [Sheuella amnicola]NDY81854.1 YihY family inner membrane protein [Sheuella amnicola]
MNVPTPNSDQANTHRSGQTRGLGIIQYLWHCAVEINLLQIASNLTFNTVLAIVPLLAVVLALFTAFPHFQEFRDALQGFMTQSLMPVDLSNNVMAHLNEFAAQATKLTTIGGAFLVVTVMLLIMTIDSALATIWHIRKHRTFANRLIVYWSLISLGPILMGASLWATAIIARESLGLVNQMPILLEITLKVLPAVIIGFGLSTLFVIVPSCKVRYTDALVGGFLSALILEFMKFAFAYYVSSFTSYAVIYGAFAALPVFLIWVYLSWLGVLVGAILTASMPAIRHNRINTQIPPGSKFFNAILILQLLAESRGSMPPGRSESELIEATSLRPQDLGEVLDALSNLGWIACTNESNALRWILACDIASARFGMLVDKMVLNRKALNLESHPELEKALGVLFTRKNDPLLQDVLLHHDKVSGQPIQSAK